MTGERGLVAFFFADGYLPEPRVSIQLRKILGVSEGVDTLVHARERAVNLDGNRVDLPVIRA